jgi:hypothetical protein
VIDLLDGALGLAVGVLSSSVFVLGLFIGFCVLFGLMKLRPTGRRGRIVRNLDEALSHRPARYLSPDDPHGQTDQLRTPELAEAAQRKPCVRPN